jgi:hypothetical protein
LARCKNCGKGFHACNNCGFINEWEYDYCCEYCWQSSTEFTNNISNLNNLINSMDEYQIDLFKACLDSGLFSFYEYDYWVKTIIDNKKL